MGKPKNILVRRSERIFNRRHSLPVFEEESSDEADEGAVLELNGLTDEGDVIDSITYDESDGGSGSEEYVSEEEGNHDDEDDWTDNTKHLDNLTQSFDGMPSVADVMGEKEVDYFGKLLNESITQRIVDETNLYSLQNQSKNWTPLSCQELLAFVGMLILMGIHQLPTLKCYWSSDPILRVDAIAAVMPASRFKKIVENLHLNDNEKQLPRTDPNYDKLHKLRPLLDHLNDVIDRVYKPSSRYSIDESMIKFKGRCFLKQYMPQKPIKWGYKVWCLADALTGYIISFFIYTGQEVSKFATTLGERVVMKLAAKIKPGSIVAFDNFFTSFSLMKNLATKNIFACGTVKSNSKGLPDFMRNNKANQKVDKNMKRGEFQFKAKNRIAAVKWIDKKPVRFLSTAHSPRNVSNVRRRIGKGSRVDIGCPKVVEDYNKIMGGVDKFDQYHERYAID
ncbi:piggyBac transposable element-derived protein 4-like [Bradysia coprophila]|uniref:piggyBac transposable element-derived protein 4-like n=1 Tax=Bradysia coprophila TaxID=38358 RepID=UPI00187DD717|nr:piggyBac transposable element-derived protein 4-like [Bradysia coprophila]